MPADVRSSPRRATVDAVALVLAYIALESAIVIAVVQGWVDWEPGIMAVLALGAIVLLLFRDDVMGAIAASNEKLTRVVDDEAVRRALDELAPEGWTVDHNVLSARGRRLGTVLQGPAGAYLVETRNRAYRIEHLGRARHHAAWLNGEVGGWVTPVLCLSQRDDTPHRRDGVWVMGLEHLLDWLRARRPPAGKQSS